MFLQNAVIDITTSITLKDLVVRNSSNFASKKKLVFNGYLRIQNKCDLISLRTNYL